MLEFSQVWEIVESWLVYGLCKYVFMNHRVIFPNLDNKTNLVLATFCCILDISRKKKLLQSATDLTVMISLCCFKNSSLKWFVSTSLAKDSREIKLGEFKSYQKCFAK